MSPGLDLTASGRGVDPRGVNARDQPRGGPRTGGRRAQERVGGRTSAGSTIRPGSRGASVTGGMASASATCGAGGCSSGSSGRNPRPPMGAPMQRAGGVERWSGQCPHVVARAAQPAGSRPHADDAGAAAAEAGHSAPGRQSRSVIAEPSGHHWTSGSAAANASGTIADARRRAVVEPMRIRIIIGIRPARGVSPRSCAAGGSSGAGRCAGRRTTSCVARSSRASSSPARTIRHRPRLPGCRGTAASAGGAPRAPSP